MPLTNLNRRLDNSRLSQSRKRNPKKTLIRFLVILLILFFTIYLPIRGVYSSAKVMVASARAVSDAAKRENLDDIRKNIKEMKKANSNMNTSLNFLIWAGFIPYFGGFYSDVRHFSKAAGYELTAASKMADSLDPYKQELGFTGTPSPGTDRVAQMVKVLNKIIPKLNEIQPDLEKASKEVAKVNVNKYPETIAGRKVRSRVDTAKNFITGAYFAVSEARSAIEVAPSALGEPSAKNYMIIFQNDKEIRPTGGFMTAYAYLKLDKGRISSSASDDIYRLDEKLLKVCETKVCPIRPPAPLVKYLPEANGKPRTTWSMRDSNLSPDVPTSMKDFERMYALLGEGVPFDGIILIDTHVVEELIKITGPIEVFGTRYSSENDKRCNCPNVIFELENYAQIIEKGEKDRKAILGTLMSQILARSLGSATDKLPEFINAGVKLANSKHLMLYLHDSKAQTAISKLNWTGEIKSSSGDYLHINDANFAGGKSNLYVTQTVNLDIDTDKRKSKLVIEYKNPEDYRSWLNQRNRDYVRIYVPKGAKLIRSKGSNVTTIEELGKTVFEAFIEVRPQNSIRLEMDYELPNSYKIGKEYPILIQKQGGKKDFKYSIKVDGKKTDFVLDSDKELKLSI